MLGWLWNILIGQFCGHKWEIIEKTDRTSEGQRTGTNIRLQCQKCGDVKLRRL